MTDQPPLEPITEPPFDPPEAPDPPPVEKRNLLPAVIGVAVIVALLGTIIAVYRNRDADTASQTAAPTTAAPIPTSTSTITSDVPTSPPTPSELDDVVADISAFVEDARGLTFDRPVEVELLDNDAFSKRVRDDAVDDLDELEKTEGVLRALGLLEDDVNLVDVLKTLLGDSVVGFYDPETDELVVRGAALTPYVRLTLAHELTHALDDQHFELDRPDLDEADDERGTGFSALVEGNALRIEDEYRETLSDDERQQAEDEEAELGEGIDYSSMPRVLPEIIAFPYAFGPGLLETLVAEGGEDRVNEAFSEPPVTSEQVIDPQAWLDGDQDPVTVDPPPADGQIIDQGVLGMWGIVILLEDELGQAGAAPVAQGWGGDWYVAWQRGDDVCVRNTLVMDSESDLDELVDALDEWAAGQPDAEVDRADGSVTYTACG